MTTDPLQIVASTGDPAFATDEAGRIVIWNKGAEKLLGRDASEVLGRPCHEMVEGKDLFGNRFCHENCCLHRMIRREEAICSFEVDFARPEGGPVRVGVSIVAVPGPRPSQYSLVHLLRPISRQHDDAGRGPSRVAGLRNPGEKAAPGSLDYSLTPREMEILAVLSKGWSTQEIADRLYISVATVRNHVQSILKKLEVHSRVEAVSLALRERLI